MIEPSRSRGVLSSEDFKLLRKAMERYLPTVSDSEDSKNFNRLYHRLGGTMRR